MQGYSGYRELVNWLAIEMLRLLDEPPTSDSGQNIDGGGNEPGARVGQVHPSVLPDQGPPQRPADC